MYDNVNDYWNHVCEDARFYNTYMFCPQVDYLRDVVGEGGVSPRIKTLLRYETLSEDWLVFTKQHKLGDLEHKHKSILRSGALHWRDELSEQTIKGIGELYADDFEHLNYERL